MWFASAEVPDRAAHIAGRVLPLSAVYSRCSRLGPAFQLFGVEEVFHIFHAVFQPDLAGAFPQSISLDPGIKAFAGGLGIDKSTILGTQAAQIDREAVPEDQLAEAFLIELMARLPSG